jgi:hypothetical protein
MFKIEKSVPIPMKTNQRTKALKKLVDKMKPGDSFLVPKDDAMGIRNSLNTLRVKFCSRKEGEKHFRFWTKIDPIK